MLKGKKYIGPDILKIIPGLAELRMSVFRDFPYLYEGEMAYEEKYLMRYANNKNAFVFTVFDGNKMVGATTAMPLADESEDIKAPFIEAGFDLYSIFYFGESVLLQDYRRQGIGRRFFEERENYALQFPEIKITAFCAVDRPENHPLRPTDYRPNDAFWAKRAYMKQPHLQCSMSWQDIDKTEETFKTLTFWTKKWR
jgi:GNAT superfamily N-acetyltransferase